MRKVIQIATAGVENTCSTQCNHITTALCMDGTMWGLRDNSANPTWVQLPPLPPLPLQDPLNYSMGIRESDGEK